MIGKIERCTEFKIGLSSGRTLNVSPGTLSYGFVAGEGMALFARLRLLE